MNNKEKKNQRRIMIILIFDNDNIDPSFFFKKRTLSEMPKFGYNRQYAVGYLYLSKVRIVS